MNARGWSAYTSKGNTKADALASCLYASAAEHFPAGIKIRSDWSDKDPDWEENFYILSKEDIEFLNSPDGRKAIVALHVDGIIKYIGQ